MYFAHPCIVKIDPLGKVLEMIAVWISAAGLRYFALAMIVPVEWYGGIESFKGKY